MSKTSVLFVCLGNICRSPHAEGIFKSKVEQRGLGDKYNVDSCGTGSWHVGSPPHIESQAVAKQHSVSLAGQKSRQLADEDFFNFDYIVAMDESNLRDIEAAAISEEPKMFCLRKFDPQADSLCVPDPFYEGGFEGVFQMIERSLEKFLDELEA